MDWNPRYLYEKVFQDNQEMDFFLKEVCDGVWNHAQDAGRTFEEGIKVLSEEFPEYTYEIGLYQSRWIEMINGSIERNVEIFHELDNMDNVCSYSITNWSSETFPLVRHSYDFFESFIDIIVSGEEKIAKPDPEIYLILQNRYSLIPENTVFIDDNELNTRAAENLGWHSIHYTSATNLRQELLAKVEAISNN